MNRPLPVTATVEVDATPEEVWQAFADVTRMSEWSPECRRIVVLGSRKHGVGTRFLGINRHGWVVWPTTSTVVRYEPGRAVAWKTRESGATWTYEIARTTAGTRLTGRRDLPAYTLATRVAGPVLGGARGHDLDLAAGIETTLRRIKAAVEQG